MMVCLAACAAMRPSSSGAMILSPFWAWMSPVLRLFSPRSAGSTLLGLVLLLSILPLLLLLLLLLVCRQSSIDG